MGDINVYTGPMKCGKSHVILQEAKRQMIAGKTIQIFKPGIDTRFSKDYVQDRNGNKLKAINIDSIDELKDISNSIKECIEEKKLYSYAKEYFRLHVYFYTCVIEYELPNQSYTCYIDGNKLVEILEKYVYK